MVTAIGHISGAHLNPAADSGASLTPSRSFGPALVAGVGTSHWIYRVGSSLGAIIGALVYQSIREPGEIVVLQLPAVKRKSETRPQKCPYCQGETFQRWGKVDKPVRDNRYRNIQVYRYYCCHCRQTFRHYPEGVDPADQTQRMRQLAAIY